MGIGIQQREQDHDPKPTFIKVLPPVAAAAAPRPSPMLRLLSSLAIAAFLTALLIFRFSLSFSPSSADFPLEQDFPVLNSTLADLASDDPSEVSLRREISLLEKADFNSLSRSPPFLTWRRSFHPVDLASPSFRLLYRLRFLPLLSDWSSRRRSSRPEDSLSSLPALLGRYSSCAVVGNSGILLNSDHGAAIDSHDAVIRLNNAPIAPFPKHVGSKTTLSFVNSNILHLCARRRDCACHPYGASVPVLLYLCQPLHLLDLAACNASSHSPFLVTPPAFDLLCAKIVKYYSLRRWFDGAGGRNRTLEGWFAAHDGLMFHYSSGMQAVMTAVGVCDKVSLFGFGKAATARHHYHTNQRGELDLHDYEAEYELYRDLAERPQAIPFLSGVQLPPVRIYH